MDKPRAACLSERMGKKFLPYDEEETESNTYTHTQEKEQSQRLPDSEHARNTLKEASSVERAGELLQSNCEARGGSFRPVLLWHTISQCTKWQSYDRVQDLERRHKGRHLYRACRNLSCLSWLCMWQQCCLVRREVGKWRCEGWCQRELYCLGFQESREGHLVATACELQTRMSRMTRGRLSCAASLQVVSSRWLPQQHFAAMRFSTRRVVAGPIVRFST